MDKSAYTSLIQWQKIQVSFYFQVVGDGGVEQQ